MITNMRRLSETTIAKYRELARTGDMTPHQVMNLLSHMGLLELFEGYTPPRKRAHELQQQGMDAYAAWQKAWTEQVE